MELIRALDTRAVITAQNRLKSDLSETNALSNKIDLMLSQEASTSEKQTFLKVSQQISKSPH